MISIAAPIAPPFEEMVQEDRVHRLMYTDPDIFELEMEHVFAGTWVYVGHQSEVAQPGDFKTTDIARQPVILTRDYDGQLRLLFNRCMHRGAVVCREQRGNVKSFRCLYHGWTYECSGELSGVPYRAGYGGELKMKELGLVPVPNVASYRGFVFACLAQDAEPFDSYLGRAKHYLDQLMDWAPDGEVEVARVFSRYAYRANWKLHLENWTDSYHPAFTHEALFTYLEKTTGRPGPRGDAGSENVDLGHGHSMLDYSAGKTGPVRNRNIHPELRSRLEQKYGPERAERVLQTAMNLNIYPNLLFRVVYPQRQILVIRPISVDYTEMDAYHYRLKGAPAEVNNAGVQHVANGADMVQSDDQEAYERIQQGLRIPSIEWLLFNRGISRAQRLPNGEIRGPGADEVGHRGQHREYLRLLLQRERTCCTADRPCGASRLQEAAIA